PRPPDRAPRRDPDRRDRAARRPRGRVAGGRGPMNVPATASTPLVHEARYRVRFDEAGPDGRLRTSGLMRYAQDLAWLHSTALGFGREWDAEGGPTSLVPGGEAR